MTAISDALVQAGVKLPTANFKVWHHLKDNPGKTLRQLSKAKVIENYASLSSVLAQAVHREILTAKPEFDRPANRVVLHYYANRSSFEEAMQKAGPHKKSPKKPKSRQAWSCLQEHKNPDITDAPTTPAEQSAMRKLHTLGPDEGPAIQPWKPHVESALGATPSDQVTASVEGASLARAAPTTGYTNLVPPFWLSGTVEPGNFDAKAYAEAMSLKEAKALYDVLHTFFKGSVA